MVDAAISRASGIIDSGKDNFVRLAELLYEKEVIFAEDIEAILGPKVKPPASEAADVAKDSPAENSPDENSPAENSPDEDAATEENNG